MSTFHVKDLRTFSTEVLAALGVKSEEAETVSDALLRANLEGVDSHGLSRLVVYSNRLKDDRINPAPNIRFEQRGASVLTVDGDNGLGHVVSSKAVEKGMELAIESGMAGISIKNSNHFGTASYYCQMACEKNLAAIAFTNSPPGIAPWGGRQAFFGTNPIAFGFPNGSKPPVIIDLSTSVVARGKIILADKQGESIPDGWALDEEGQVTNDPGKALTGSVLPLGGAKGFALALAVEILSGVLSGAAFGPNVNSIYQEASKTPANVGHFFILMDIEKFMPHETFQQSMEQLIHQMKETPKAPGFEEIRYPGERRTKEFERRLEDGIPLTQSVQDELKSLGEAVNIPFPQPISSFNHSKA
ncbi:Ldh family oxidoreductase [Thalassobacillus pellis]|uniref:Ldh family oxidoreductase n=1 Tax=Thalassobacillus pellis TaxID=748008 RepID=UPI00195F7F58|nr:Ldh family oxidoreductase [Thalassobacillus pellis]MBM7554468.1 LDH2 family malate/lactate/ureidoglycolate dehydrogenase [Thalassobacillus pellis]